jgi:hypothetical protein
MRLQQSDPIFNMGVNVMRPAFNFSPKHRAIIPHTYLPMKMEQTKCSETSAYKIQTPGNYPEESIQHSEHGESLKSRIGLQNGRGCLTSKNRVIM